MSIHILIVQLNVAVVVQLLNRVQLFVTPWTVAYQAHLSKEFPRQEYWSGLPFPSPGDLPDPGIEPTSPAWQGDSLPLSHLVSPQLNVHVSLWTKVAPHMCVCVCVRARAHSLMYYTGTRVYRKLCVTVNVRKISHLCELSANSWAFSAGIWQKAASHVIAPH